jgi:hypothetical protein
MNRKQSIVLFFVLIALVVTWLFPHWVPRYKPEPFKPGPVPAEGVYHPSDFYAFLFTESGVESRIDWERLLLTDLIIAAVGAPILYALRSKAVKFAS